MKLEVIKELAPVKFEVIRELALAKQVVVLFSNEEDSEFGNPK